MERYFKRMIAHLKRVAPMPEEEKERLEAMFVPQGIAKGGFFLQAGDEQRTIGFNLKGVFRYFYIDYEGAERTKHFCTEDNWVMSLSAFLDNSPSLFYIQALEESEILAAPAETPRGLLENNAYWQGVYRNLLETNYVAKEKREADFLFNDARGRYMNFLNEYPSLSKRIKQRHIASYLGINPVSLSRIRASMKSNRNNSQ